MLVKWSGMCVYVCAHAYVCVRRDHVFKGLSKVELRQVVRPVKMLMWKSSTLQNSWTKLREWPFCDTGPGEKRQNLSNSFDSVINLLWNEDFKYIGW